MARTVKLNTIGSFTIKRKGAIVKGTKGKQIAHLSNLEGDDNSSKSKKRQNA
ncbi:hypothetical protein [Neobacillus kokaensis]|uniref:Uncharacterized protein n=1 Tax=Neobacillus kokaensis TaxID=2759023 RepID=A0ABQ3NAK7_9BACI|nr:hypothetical protein [Neobacillus kokaensis]GHI00766.1 hypothetical protein AM1BK_43080 [Neobacillus kokaensis]